MPSEGRIFITVLSIGGGYLSVPYLRLYDTLREVKSTIGKLQG